MSGCPGLHCDGCGSGGPTAGAVIVLIVVGVVAAAHRTIEHAAVDVLHAVEIGLIAVAALGVTGLAIAAVVAAERARRRRQASATLPPAVTVQAVSVVRPKAIEAAPQAAARPVHAARAGQPARAGMRQPRP